MTTLRFGGQWSCWVRLEHRVNKKWGECLREYKNEKSRHFLAIYWQRYEFLIPILAINDQRVGIEIQIHVPIRFVASKLPTMKSKTNNCNQHVEFRRWNLKTKIPEIPPKKKHPKMFAFAIPCGFGSWFLLRLPPGVWLGKGLFLPSWCHCSSWSNFLEQDHHSEDWNWEHSNFGVAKTLWQFDLWRQPYCMIVWVSTLFIFMKGTLLTCTDAEAVFRRPNWNIFSARKYSGYTSPAPFKDLDRIALTGSASKPWLRLL